MTVSSADRPVVCESCGAAAPERPAGGQGGFHRPENADLTDEELVSLKWLFSGTGWLCRDCAPPV